jgi:hypothetical protein
MHQATQGPMQVSVLCNAFWISNMPMLLAVLMLCIAAGSTDAMHGALPCCLNEAASQVRIHGATGMNDAASITHRWRCISSNMHPKSSDAHRQLLLMQLPAPYLCSTSPAPAPTATAPQRSSCGSTALRGSRHAPARCAPPPAAGAPQRCPEARAARRRHPWW